MRLPIPTSSRSRASNDTVNRRGRLPMRIGQCLVGASSEWCLCSAFRLGKMTRKLLYHIAGRLLESDAKRPQSCRLFPDPESMLSATAQVANMHNVRSLGTSPPPTMATRPWRLQGTQDFPGRAAARFDCHRSWLATFRAISARSAAGRGVRQVIERG